ncbi:MAG: hypothetical protein PHS89_00740 [Syntrophaceticus schinkii]|nr:hypothetical protein [Syntrophaceticus schinkii]
MSRLCFMMPHSPRFPEILDAPHSLGQSLHGSSNSFSSSIRRANSPLL